MLSNNEKLILYGLAKHPLFSSRELAERLNLNLSTVIACKRRLKKEGFFYRVRIPIAQYIGCEMLHIAFATFILGLSLDKRLKLGAKFDIEHPEVFWMLSEPSQGMTLQFSRSYSDTKERLENIEKVYTKHGFLGGSGITLLSFPLKLTKIYNFFNYAFLLKYLFDIEDEKISFEFGGKSIKLTNREKKVYYALIKYPELSDKDLAKTTRVSRATVSSLRKKFDGKIMKTEYIIDLKKLEIKIVALIHMKFNLATSLKIKEGIAKSLLFQGSIFLILEHVDLVALTPFKDFDAYRTYMNRFSEIHKEYEILAQEPTILLFALSESRFPKTHVYAPLVKKVLNI
ncbi:MAG: winged helix-turn-helix domain-containing protein [Candidatus Thermoplasmatota archaeon]